ncbi:hypothetical protein [Rhizobium sp. PP-CC-3G-465]|uniref:hypothetical protein n=1 Tax=Rhizobium sp. PP-CC-3G-465 TaxID=2135648 RepID=UPI00104FD136
MSEILQKYLSELIAQRDETARRFVEGEGDKYDSAAKSAARFVQLQQAITILENDGKIPLTVLSGRVDG